VGESVRGGWWLRLRDFDVVISLSR
jgi:hypothetical protein